jgi:1,4-dihydroxy-2-naphthoyl-CoA hydrolase
MTEAATPTGTDDVSSLGMDLTGTLIERMGIEVLEATRQRLVATMPVVGNTQPYGLLHGGASVVLAETLGSIGAGLHAGPGRIAVGLDINATCTRAARDGLVTGTATLLSGGRTLVSYDVVITDEGGRRVCTSRITCLLRDAVPGA